MRLQCWLTVDAHLQFDLHAPPLLLVVILIYLYLGKPSSKKNGKKGDIVPFGQPLPKRVKRGHLLSDYRQKCINVTRDSRHFDVKSA